VDPVERAAAYGFPGVTTDGNDPEAMFAAVWEARERAVSGGGPTLIEAVTMRMHGHAAHDDMKYVPKAQVDEWRAKDPIDRQEARLRELKAEPPLAERKPDDNDVVAVPVGASPQRGPSDAWVTVVAFLDYQCPFCGRVQSTLAELQRANPDVRLVVTSPTTAFVSLFDVALGLGVLLTLPYLLAQVGGFLWPA
ncbi:MAG: twin-arginine translocase subunit TatC, partial [Thermoplasmatota archaeon]